jgi:hypothetical protein
MVLVSETSTHVRLRCEDCEAHTLVERNALDGRLRRGQWLGCRVCGATSKVSSSSEPEAIGSAQRVGA